MAFIHGSTAAVSLDNAAGTPVTITSYVSEATFNQLRELADVTTFSQTTHVQIPGLGDATFSMSGPFDATINTQMGALMTATSSSSLVYYPNGNSSGKPSISVEVWVSSYEIGSPVDDKGTWSAELQATGAVTYGTVA